MPPLLCYLRAAIGVSLDTLGSTLLDIREIFASPDHKKQVLRKCRNDQTRQTLTEFQIKIGLQQVQMIEFLQNSPVALADRLPLRHFLAQPTVVNGFQNILRNELRPIVGLSDMNDEPKE